jgi:hypothetical protein
VEVSPTAHDGVSPGTFDVRGTVNVHDAMPNVTFTVLRRVDLNPDGICTGTSWLNLPGTPTPVLNTSDGGAGALHFEIARGAPLLDGVSFDVQWRLVGNDRRVGPTNSFRGFSSAVGRWKTEGHVGVGSRGSVAGRALDVCCLRVCSSLIGSFVVCSSC